MSENEQAVDTGVQSQAPSAEPVQAQSESVKSEPTAESPTTAPAKQEKMFAQSQVSAIAAKEARRAEERARSEAKAYYEQQLAQAQQQQAQPQNLGGIQQQPSQADFEQAVQQAAYNLSQKSRAHQIEQTWNSAMEAARLEDPEFADKYDALGIEEHPELVIEMANMDNKVDMLKDLANNPAKYSTILALSGQKKMTLARNELTKLSASIRANVEAQKQPKVDAPLSQLKPSNIGGDDGKLSVSDYRKIFRG